MDTYQFSRIFFSLHDATYDFSPNILRRPPLPELRLDHVNSLLYFPELGATCGDWASSGGMSAAGVFTIDDTHGQITRELTSSGGRGATRAGGGRGGCGRGGAGGRARAAPRGARRHGLREVGPRGRHVGLRPAPRRPGPAGQRRRRPRRQQHVRVTAHQPAAGAHGLLRPREPRWAGLRWRPARLPGPPGGAGLSACVRRGVRRRSACQAPRRGVLYTDLVGAWPGQAAGKIQHGRRHPRPAAVRGGANEEARQVQVEPALHRPLMELRRRADHGLAYLSFSWRELFPVSTAPWTSFFMTSGRAPVPVLLRRRRASALRHEHPRYPVEEQAMQAAMERLASRAGDGFVEAGGGTRRGMARLADEASIDIGKPPSPPDEPLQHREEGGPDSLCQRRSGEISDGGAFDICCRWTHLIHQSQRGVSHQRCKGTSLDIADNCHSCACASSLHHQSIREHLSRGQCFLGILKGLDYLGNSVFS